MKWWMLWWAGAIYAILQLGFVLGTAWMLLNGVKLP
jgi:hypothetical protein